MRIRLDHAAVAGKFSRDDARCVVIDARHDVEAVREVVAGREVLAILATHAHDHHVRVARRGLAVTARTGWSAPPGDQLLSPGGNLGGFHLFNFTDVVNTQRWRQRWLTASCRDRRSPFRHRT